MRFAQAKAMMASPESSEVSPSALAASLAAQASLAATVGLALTLVLGAMGTAITTPARDAKSAAAGPGSN